MNKKMKISHFETLSDPTAQELYERLCQACAEREGGMKDADQMLVADICQAEQIKKSLTDDIAKRGIGQEKYNGRQSYYQENKSLAQLRQFCESQRKGLSELRLTPSSRKAAAVELDDEFAAF